MPKTHRTTIWLQVLVMFPSRLRALLSNWRASRALYSASSDRKSAGASVALPGPNPPKGNRKLVRYVRMSALILSKDQWFWQNLIILMCDTKFLTGNEKIYDLFIKKPCFEILSGFFHFWPFQVSKKFIVPSLEMKTFFLWIGRMGHEKILLFVLISNMYTQKKF